MHYLAPVLLATALAPPAAMPPALPPACEPVKSIPFKEPPRFENRSYVFPSGSLKLGGCLYRPAGAAKYPVLVLVSGSDDTPTAADIYTVIHAKAFTAQGIGVFAFNKRGLGGSEGAVTDTDFASRAQDVAAAIQFVRRLPTTTAVAVWGSSQAGWVIPQALHPDDGVQFVMLVSPAGVNPNDQIAFFMRNLARRLGMNAIEAADAEVLHRAVVKYYATGKGYEAAQALVDRLRPKPWFEKFRANEEWDEKIGADGRLLPPAELRKAWKTRASDFAFYRAPDTFRDYGKAYEAIDRPVLVVHGSADGLVPVPDSIAAFRAAFARNGNHAAEFKIFEGAEHGGQDGPRVRPAYLDFTSDWAARHFVLAEGGSARGATDPRIP